MFIYKSKYKKVGVLPIWLVKSNVLSVGPSSERNITVRTKAAKSSFFYNGCAVFNDFSRDNKLF